MARALWKGAISFGLVHIPVELISASVDHELDLSMLDRRDFAPIGYKRYNKTTGKEVEWDDIIMGYEYKTDEYVVLSEEDLRQANVKATQTIDILTFADAVEVPLTFYEHPYYLLPAKGGEKVYALLRETLRKANKVGIASVVMRTKQHLCALLCVGDAIVLNTLRYADEIRPTDDLDLPASNLKAAGISDKELKMALSLVDGMSEAWEPRPISRQLPRGRAGAGQEKDQGQADQDHHRARARSGRRARQQCDRSGRPAAAKPGQESACGAGPQARGPVRLPKTGPSQAQDGLIHATRSGNICNHINALTLIKLLATLCTGLPPGKPCHACGKKWMPS